MSFTLALIGRPNVGKSTLFNRLVGKRLALVDDRPGVTRDLREGEARLDALRFRVVDTAGLEDAPEESLAGRMRGLSERAVDAADAVLFMIDARVGVTAADQLFAEMLRKRAKVVLLGANKAEGHAGRDGALEAYGLGLGEPVLISAEHGEGMIDLAEALAPLVEAADAASQEAITDLVVQEDGSAEDAPERPMQIAVIGRPNAGKSTLVNRILGEDRLLTGPEAGITRDAIAVTTTWDGVPMRIFDTAGMRKKARVQEKLEKLSVADGLRAVKFAEVVVLLIDVASPFDAQDLRIADLAEREGRAVVFAINKWDTEEDKSETAKRLREALARLLPQLRGAPLVALSAQTGKGLDKLHSAIVSAHEVWNRRVPTAKLNQWLAGEVSAHPPPAPGGRRLKLRYMTQVKTRPPSFVAFCSIPEALPKDYQRFLVNGLRRDFDMPGVPIRLMLRGGDNPFEGKSAKRPQKFRKGQGKGGR